MGKVRIIGKFNDGTKIADIDFGVYETELAKYHTANIARFGGWDAAHIRYYSPYHFYYFYHVTADIRPVMHERCRNCPATFMSSDCNGCQFNPLMFGTPISKSDKGGDSGKDT